MTTESLKDLIYEAQEHLNEAISLLETYVREANDSYAEDYIVDHLKIFAGRDHGFLSSDLNLDDLLEQLDDHEEDQDEEEQGNGMNSKKVTPRTKTKKLIVIRGRGTAKEQRIETDVTLHLDRATGIWMSIPENGQ